MRIWHPIIGLLLCTGLGAGEDATPLAEAITILPYSVSIDHDLRFDEKGKVRSTSSRMSLNLRVQVPADRGVVGYRKLAIDRVVTDADEVLRPLGMGSHPQDMLREMSGGHSYLNLSFEPPAKPCKAIVELAGSFELVSVAGKRKKVTLAPIAKWAAAIAEIPTVPGATISLDVSHQDRFGVRFSKQLRGLVTDVRFYGADGRAIEARSYGSSSSGESFTRIFRAKPGDGGKVVIYFFEKLQGTPCPFALKDIPCAPRPKATERIKVEAEDAAEEPKDDAEEVRPVEPGQLEF